MVIAENTTHLITNQGVVDYGKCINKRWAELIDPPKQVEKEEDNRPSEEIAEDIWARIRGH